MVLVHLRWELGKVTAQHKRRQSGTSALGVIARASGHLVESSPMIKTTCRQIGFLDLEKYRLNTEAGQPPQVKVEERPRDAAAAPPRRNRDREDFRFVGGHARQYEPGEFPAMHGAVRDDLPVKQQPLNLVFAPAAAERGRMERREGGGIARRGFAQGQLAGRKQPGEETDHRRGNRAPSWGRASGARR